MRHLDAPSSSAVTRIEGATILDPRDQATIRIAGVGLLTPLGRSAETTWSALLRGEHIRAHARVPVDSGENQPRAITLAIRAARAAVEEARWGSLPDQNARTAVVIGTSKGTIESWLTPPLHMCQSPYVTGGLQPDGIGQVASAIGHELNLHGPRLTISAACASGLHAVIRAAIMLKGREADRAVVVAVESSLHPLFEGSFGRLGVLASPGDGCRPFDESRGGFLMGEAAAAVCLEAVNTEADRSDEAGPCQAKSVSIERFALGGDATHLTASDPGGATLRRLLRNVIGDRPIDLVHAHGTGTVANDATELAAIESVVASGSSPAVYSHKGALGHSLGAAGLVSVVLNCQMHRHGIVPPNVQTRTPLRSLRVSISQDAQSRSITRSACIAAGFGGPIAAVGLATSAI